MLLEIYFSSFTLSVSSVTFQPFRPNSSSPCLIVHSKFANNFNQIQHSLYSAVYRFNSRVKT